MSTTNLSLQQSARQLRREELSRLFSTGINRLAEILRTQHEASLRRVDNGRRMRNVNGSPA